MEKSTITHLNMISPCQFSRREVAWQDKETRHLPLEIHSWTSLTDRPDFVVCTCPAHCNGRRRTFAVATQSELITKTLRFLSTPPDLFVEETGISEAVLSRSDPSAARDSPAASAAAAPGRAGTGAGPRSNSPAGAAARCNQPTAVTSEV